MGNKQNEKPFVLNTGDDFSLAPLAASNGNCQPSHTIAFRTVDHSDVNNNSAPFYPQNSYGGGKLGVYSFWDTCDQNSNAPITPINNTTAPNQYEFYNYSVHPAVGSLPANPRELGNQFFNSDGSNTTQGMAYYNDFFGTGSPGINVQNELYQLNVPAGAGNDTLQAAAAVNAARLDYLQYIECTSQATGSDGRNSACAPVGTCPPLPPGSDNDE